MNMGKYGGLGISLACLMLGAPQASACGWWWCDDGRYGYRPPARAYGYRSPPRVYAYAARPSTSLPQTRGYLASAPPLPTAGAGGLTAPIATAEGLREGALPGKGPTLFGPPAPAPGYYYSGYYYNGGYYNGPGYYYNGYSRPPPPTAWVEPRQRRR